MGRTAVKAALGAAVTVGLVGVLSVLMLQRGLAQTPEPDATATPGATSNDDTLRTVTVSGFGQVEVVPDQAVVRVGVQTDAESAGQALTQNNEQMQALLTSLTDAGIAPQDVQTQNLSLYPRYGEVGTQTVTGTQQIVGYTASNVVEVIVRDLSGLGDLLDAAIAAGGNTIENIRFTVSDASSQLDQARSAAVDDARRKAQQLVALVDAQLGEVVTISELNTVSPLLVARAQAEGAGGAVPVEPGTQSLSVQVQVTWRLQGGSSTISSGGTATPEVEALPAETSTAAATRTPIVQSVTPTAITPIATTTQSSASTATSTSIASTGTAEPGPETSTPVLVPSVTPGPEEDVTVTSEPTLEASITATPAP